MPRTIEVLLLIFILLVAIASAAIIVTLIILEWPSLEWHHRARQELRWSSAQASPDARRQVEGRCKG
jgi:hypothetical protein